MQLEERKTAGIGPEPRGYTTLTLFDSRLLLIGGFDGTQVFDDFYTLDLASYAFVRPSSASTTSPI